MMNRFFCTVSLALAVSLAGLTGCSKSNSTSPQSEAKPVGLRVHDTGAKAQDLLVAKIHWLGKKRLAADSNATNFMAIWNLPESATLEAQTLEKLSTAPWRLLKTETPLSNAPVALLRPLLDDLVQEESYLEVRGGTNQPGELVFAIRLDATRAALWQTNVAAVLESLTGVRSATSDFSLSLSRSGDWTLLSVSPAALSTNRPQPSTPNSPPATLLDRVQDRIATTQIPFPPGTNYWLESEVDVRPINEAFRLGAEVPANLPRFALRVLGDSQNIRTSGELSFPQPLNLNLEPWRIPTNYICDPLVSFTALRGVAPWLASWEGWPAKTIGPPPNQIYFWAQSPALWLHFLTYPDANASNHISAMSDYVLDKWNPIFLTNRVGKFDWEPDTHRLVWNGIPYFKPMLQRASYKQNDYLFFGLFRNEATNRPVPPELFAEFQSKTNLVYYDWEITSPEVTSWTQMGQLVRMIFGRVQLSPRTASLPWLRAITPSLGNATTVLTLTAPNQISLKRSSTFGLTGVELHLLAEWLESPEFPVGLHTLVAKRVVRSPTVTVGTNSVPH